MSSQRAGIAWTDGTWNPISGCTKISPGCRECYAERGAERHMGEFAKDPERKFTDVQFHKHKLEMIRHIRTPKIIFVNSYSDLFHERISDHEIFQVFDAMAHAPWHIFQVLTKRARRMHELVPKIRSMLPDRLEHVWLGASAENKETLEERMAYLADTRAAVRWISLEPLLEGVSLEKFLFGEYRDGYSGGSEGVNLNAIDWVVVGGESGQNARKFELAWAERILEECKSAHIPFFMKQMGTHPAITDIIRTERKLKFKTGKLKAWKGDDPNEWPEHIRVQQLPRAGQLLREAREEKKREKWKEK